ncbi:type IV secretion system protein, partial [Klebsiella pneumoniae]|uniref:type IV secretion system protein n=1 Tax=Klebsiella pneumoniae TaxID=573 RepID=UPI00396886CF
VFLPFVCVYLTLLLGITAPIFIFCLMYGFLRPMFNNWLQNIFAGILTILFAALSLRIVVNYLILVLNKATKVADS